MAKEIIIRRETQVEYQVGVCEDGACEIIAQTQKEEVAQLLKAVLEKEQE
jgi:acylphosphatase